MKKTCDNDWHGKEYAFFSHKNCEKFPCHKAVIPDNFNCLFCYCPLYVLGNDCGGSFIILSNGTKDCSGCTFPHEKDNYGAVIERFAEIAAHVKQSKQLNG